MYQSPAIEPEIDRILDQYRESPKLIHMMRTYLAQVAEAMDAIEAIPSFFDIDTAVGDQLTKLGQRLGWPRCHCVCTVQPVYGFECDTVSTVFPIVDFCDDTGNWDDCGPFGVSDICLDDDELYRKFLKVRRYQMLSLYSGDDLTAAIQTFWGETAMILDAGQGRVVVAPGRDLTSSENAVLQLYPRVLPIAPGIRVRFHFGPQTEVFGFGDGWGGFCEPWQPEGLPLGTENGVILVTENGNPISTGPLTKDSPWMCEVDVKPYDCAS